MDTPYGRQSCRPLILEQNQIAIAIISFGNPENVNVFGRAANSRPYIVSIRFISSTSYLSGDLQKNNPYCRRIALRYGLFFTAFILNKKLKKIRA